jgi:hypothetical protein
VADRIVTLYEVVDEIKDKATKEGLQVISCPAYRRIAAYSANMFKPLLSRASLVRVGCAYLFSDEDCKFRTTYIFLNISFCFSK